MVIGTPALVRRLLCLTASTFTLLSGASFADDRAISQRIDEFVTKNYRKHGIKPNAPTSDYAFVRRSYLDIIGRVPTFQESQKFLSADSPSKRGQLIKYLLKSEGYVSHWFNYWADILRVKSSIEGDAGAAYSDWVKDSLRQNKSYRQMVRDLVTAEGYVWDNGAVGYYMRDAGMPLDNMSNTTQIFLGTQLVCAQCHNHPFDKWKQKDYYEMAAYTYGMQTRVNPEKVVNVDGRMAKLEKRGAKRDRNREMNRHIRSALRDLLEPLSYRVVHDEEKMLKLPDDYQYDDADPRETVKASTIFGKRVTGRNSKKLTSYADWLTGIDNPRFTKIIVNRLWKEVMGVGLVEPVDDFKDDTVASNPDLFAYLEREMVNIDYDMRRFLGILYNTRTYQRQSTTDDINLDDYHFPGPALRRMSAEQIWDSLLAVTIPAVDERQGGSKYRKRYEKMKEQAEGLESMKKQPQQILNVAKEIAKVEYDHDQASSGLRKRVAKAREEGNDSLAKEVNKEMRAASKVRDEKVDGIRQAFETTYVSNTMKGASMSMMKMGEVKGSAKISKDPRWKGYDGDYVRASEVRSPAPSGHFLRQFGQSDRETISAAEIEASVAQVLNLLNGEVFDQLVSSKSLLMKGIDQLYGDDEKQDYIFMSLLTREPSEREREIMSKQFSAADDSKDACKTIIWSLLNTKELLFIQ